MMADNGPYKSHSFIHLTNIHKVASLYQVPQKHNEWDRHIPCLHWNDYSNDQWMKHIFEISYWFTAFLMNRIFYIPLQWQIGISEYLRGTWVGRCEWRCWGWRGAGRLNLCESHTSTTLVGLLYLWQASELFRVLTKYKSTHTITQSESYKRLAGYHLVQFLHSRNRKLKYRS